jgi:hypothetical protein
MTTFDKREEAFENKFAHDEELRFKAEARRNRLLGLWAAEKLGITGEAAATYARDVVVAGSEQADGVLRKLVADLSAATPAIPEQSIRAKMTELAIVAAEQVKAGK